MIKDALAHSVAISVPYRCSTQAFFQRPGKEVPFFWVKVMLDLRDYWRLRMHDLSGRACITLAMEDTNGHQDRSLGCRERRARLEVSDCDAFPTMHGRQVQVRNCLFSRLIISLTVRYGPVVWS